MTGIEIERKYNVINDDWRNIPPKSVQQITQGFIHHACNLVVRVRLISNDFKTATFRKVFLVIGTVANLQ